MTAGIAFLLDADNLNEAASIREALSRFEALVGRSTIRRAYGSAETLRAINDVLADLAIRPCVNFGIEKNTTDVALVVDAMEIVCTQTLEAIAIGSGDADFFPLAIRLRELGVRVFACSLDGKMSPQTANAYEQVIQVGAPARRAAATRARTSRTRARTASPASEASDAATPARPSAGPTAPVAAVAAAETMLAPAPSASRAAAKKGRSQARPEARTQEPRPAAGTGAGKVAGTTPSRSPRAAASSGSSRSLRAREPATADPTDPVHAPGADLMLLEQILDVVPQLRAGLPVRLDEVAKPLHAAGLLSKSASSPRLFAKLPGHFELTPATQPNHVRWKASSTA
jgi:hypothetical protein